MTKNNGFSSTLPARYIGLDIIRFFSFIAICLFHVTYIHYYTPDIAITSELLIFSWMESFTRALAFSGFTVAALTSLLTAYSDQGLRGKVRLFTFLIVGWCLFSAVINNGSDFLVWDIYPLLFFGILSATLAEMLHARCSYFLGLIGFMMLWVPFWEFGQYVNTTQLPFDLNVVLGFGNCQTAQIEWPVLPWIGLIWLGYTFGQLVRTRIQNKHDMFFNIRNIEILVWVVVLSASLSQWGVFYHIKVGEFFSCEAYRQDPLVWWSHMVWPFFAMRISFDQRVQNLLIKFPLFPWISQLAVSQKFWVSYMLSYLLAHGISELGTATGLEATPWRVPATGLFCAAYLILIELCTRWVVKLYKFLFKEVS